MKNLSLTYCTNVHSIGDWASWSSILSQFGPAIRQELGWKEMPLGLWFPASMVPGLEKDLTLDSNPIQKLFLEHDLSTFTGNAFPYGNFHEKVIKTRVYHPDWSLPQRLEYTQSCAKILAHLMPQGSQGSLSTLPLGWRIDWKEKQTRASVRNILTYVKSARELADKTGRQIRLAIEPEPGCVLESLEQVVHFWNQYLRPEARAAGISLADLDAYCGLCYDTCHQAVQFENPITTLETLRSQGIPLAKMQLSSALEFKADANRESLSLRQQFMEERFLHQTRVQTEKDILRFDDLPQALDSASNSIDDLWSFPWRSHFHLPIDATKMLDSKWISTTQSDMLQAFHYALENALCPHFEIETYTWSVLPEPHRPTHDMELAQCIGREMKFILEQIPGDYTVNGHAQEGSKA